MALLQLILVVAIILAIAFVLMAIKILFHKSHRFPETSAGHNREMRKRGVNCPRHEEIKRWSSKDRRTQCSTCYEHAREH